MNITKIFHNVFEYSYWSFQKTIHRQVKFPYIYDIILSKHQKNSGILLNFQFLNYTERNRMIYIGQISEGFWEGF